MQAKTLDVYDLDSLNYLSSEVAEVEILRGYRADKRDLIDVKVTMVHKGGFKKGQTAVVAATDLYRKTDKEELNTEPLAVGDRLALFLIREKANDRIPDDAVVFVPLSGGMRLVQGGHVFDFSQWMNPGPYVANVRSASGKRKAPTIDRFREQVRDSLRSTAPTARLLEAKQDELDVPALLRLLAHRAAPPSRDRDRITELACARLAASHGPVVLSRALPLANGYYGVSILQRGFGTPKGRDYLLAKVSDAKEPMEARLGFARAMENAGAVYRSTLTEISANHYREVGEADEGNSRYLTRIAQAARANRNHEELCSRLIRCIDHLGRTVVQPIPPAMMADLHAALAVLRELYDTKPAEQLQFGIETATANADRQAYAKLKSPCGELISILVPVDPAKYTKPKERSLIFAYSYTAVLLGRDVELRPSVVIVHQNSQERVVLASAIRIRGGGYGGGSNVVVLPKDLPPGRYHVFYQVTDGGKVTSTGHYFAVDL